MHTAHTNTLISPPFLRRGASRISGASRRMMYVFYMTRLTHKVDDMEEKKGEQLCA